LESSLREASRLLKDSVTFPAPVADAGASGKDQSKKQKPAKDDSHPAQQTKRPPLADESHQTEIDQNTSPTLIRDMDVTGMGPEPKVAGTQISMSEQLGARLRVLGEVVGKENLSVLKASIQRDLEGVAQMAKTLIVPAKLAAETQVGS
jgi:hypothetical protein